MAITPTVLINVSGARGRMGDASGPLGFGAVTAETISNSPAEQSSIFSKISGSLLASTGSALIGWMQAGVGAVLRSVYTRLRDTVHAKDFGATGNGSTNDRAALALVDTVGSFRLTAGRYLVSSNLTLNSDIAIDPGARFVVPSGVTLTLNGSITAGDYQIFNVTGTGFVVGLNVCQMEWFVADVRTFASTFPTVVATPWIQKAISATKSGGIVHIGPGNYLHDGSFIDVSGGQSIVGSGFGATQTVFYWNDVSRNGFRFNNPGILGAVARDFKFDCLNGSVAPTSGIALYTNQSETSFRNIETTGSYYGTYFENMAIGRSYNVRHNDALFSSVLIDGSLDIFVNDWNHSALGDLVVLTAAPTGGAFVAGDAVTCATGSTGTVIAPYTSTRLRIQWNGIVCPVGGVITATGKSATVASVTVGHQLGSFRLLSTSRLCEGITIGDGDSVGGDFKLVTVSNGVAGRHVGNVGAITIMPGAMFDVSYKGSVFDGAYDVELNGRYASTRNPDFPGISLTNCTRINGEPRCVNNAGAGIQWDGTSQHIYIKANMDGNCRNYTLTDDMAEIRITGTAGHWNVKDGLAGFPGMNGGVNPVRAMYVSSGAHDFAVDIDCPQGSILNLATNNDQYWNSTPGMARRSPVLPAYADDAAATAGGIPFGGHYRTASGQKQRVTP